jgi:hypothetical protein
MVPVDLILGIMLICLVGIPMTAVFTLFLVALARDSGEESDDQATAIQDAS